MNTSVQATFPLPAKINRLSQAQCFKLYDAVRALHSEGGIVIGDTCASIAVKVGTSLPFTVTASNVTGALQALEIAIPKALPTGEAALLQRIKRLEDIVSTLCRELNVPFQL